MGTAHTAPLRSEAEHSISGSQIGLPASHPVDAETDLEVMKSVPKQFEITDDKTANWLVKKVMAARAYAQSVKEWADREARRAAREETTLLFLYQRQLETWCRAEIVSRGGRTKSVSLPAGTVALRTVNESLQVDDETAVLNWAKENCPQAVTVVEKLSRAVLKQYFEATGELPDAGAHVEPARESFSIR